MQGKETEHIQAEKTGRQTFAKTYKQTKRDILTGRAHRQTDRQTCRKTKRRIYRLTTDIEWHCCNSAHHTSWRDACSAASAAVVVSISNHSVENAARFDASNSVVCSPGSATVSIYLLPEVTSHASYTYWSDTSDGYDVILRQKTSYEAAPADKLGRFSFARRPTIAWLISISFARKLNDSG